MGGSDPVGSGSSGDGDAVDGADVKSVGRDVPEGAAADGGAPEVPRLERGLFGAVLSGERKVSRLEKRRAKIREEIDRNRRGEYKVPTWVLALALVAFVAGWVALIVFA